MSRETFGFESILKCADPQPANKRDMLVLFVHWNLVKNNLLCLGVGEERQLEPGYVVTEVIPPNWNQNEKYSMRYVYNDQVYLLFMISSGEMAVFNILRVDDLKLNSFAMDVDTTINQMSGPISAIVPMYKELLYNIKKNLLEGILCCETTVTSTQTDPTGNPRIIREESLVQHINNPSYGVYSHHDPLRRRIGIGDLYPGIGGGNLYPAPGRHNNNPVLPYRYDPLNPFGNRQPNPDHLRFPNFRDDNIL